MLGTTYHVKAQVANVSIEQLREQIEGLDAQMKSELSIFDPNSQLSRINRGESRELTLG